MTNWETVLDKHAESTLCQSTEEHILNYEGKPLLFHAIDRMILRLARCSMQSPSEFVVLYPVSNFGLLAPVAAEVLYGMLDKGTPRKSLLLVTNKLDVREEYQKIFARHMRLSSNVFPLHLVKRDGTLRAAARAYGPTPLKLLMSSNISCLPEDGIAADIQMAIVELTPSTPNEVIESFRIWARKNNINNVLYVETDPYSEHLLFFSEKKIPAWGWNLALLKQDFAADIPSIEKERLKYENPFSASVFSIKNLVEGIDKQAILVNCSLADELKDARALHAQITNVAEQKNLPWLAEQARYFLSAIRSIERMLAPLKYTDRECEASQLCLTTGIRIGILRNVFERIQRTDPHLAGLWAKTYLWCERVQARLANSAEGKPEQLVKILREHMAAKKSTTVLAFTEAQARAVGEYLAAELGLNEEALLANNIVVTTRKSLSKQNTDVCIVSGHPPYGQRSIFASASAKVLEFFLYPSEVPTFERQLQDYNDRIQLLFNRQSQIAIAAQLLNVPAEELSLPETTERDTRGISPSTQAILESAEDAYDEDEGDLIVDDLQDEQNNLSAVDIPCIQIVFNDGSRILVRTNKQVPIFVPKTREVEHKEASRVVPGDIIVLANNGLGESVVQAILKVVETHPAMRQHIKNVKHWVEVVRNGMKRTGDKNEDLIRRLQEKGSRLTNSLTVTWWRRGITIGPQDPQDLRRIGEVYGDDHLAKNYKEVDHSVHRIRSIRQKLFMRMHKALSRAAPAVIGESEAVDDELGIYLEDFQSRIDLQQVKELHSAIAPSAANLNKRMAVSA